MIARDMTGIRTSVRTDVFSSRNKRPLVRQELVGYSNDRTVVSVENKTPAVGQLHFTQLLNFAKRGGEHGWMVPLPSAGAEGKEKGPASIIQKVCCCNCLIICLSSRETNQAGLLYDRPGASPLLRVLIGRHLNLCLIQAVRVVSFVFDFFAGRTYRSIMTRASQASSGRTSPLATTLTPHALSSIISTSRRYVVWYSHSWPILSSTECAQ